MQERRSNPTLVLVDDHEALCAGLSILLERRGFTVLASAGGAIDGERAIVEHEPQVAVVALNLPDESGVELVRRLVGRGTHTRFVVYTSVTDPLVLSNALDSGADGFVAKVGGISVLVECLREVCRGGRYRDAAFLRLANPNGARRPRVLSRREAQILELLSTGLTGEQIAQRLVLSPETIRTHVRNAMGKLQARTRTEAVVKALDREEIRSRLSQPT
jgi:DNA-binding NarL/FixJ family response regulator